MNENNQRTPRMPNVLMPDPDGPTTPKLAAKVAKLMAEWLALHPEDVHLLECPWPVEDKVTEA